MKRNIVGVLSGLAVLLSLNSYAQKITATKITYSYCAMPAAAAALSGVKNYQVSVEAKTAVPLAMADGNKDEIFRLASNNRNISPEAADEPATVTPKDANELANWNISLRGHKRNSANALKVVVGLYEFEHSHLNLATEWETRMNATNTYTVPRYRTEFSYRYLMTASIIAPDGSKVFELVPPEVTAYKMYSGYPKSGVEEINSEMELESARNKIFRDNLILINKAVNYQLTNVKRSTVLYNIDSKPNSTSDKAYDETVSGLTLLSLNYAAAKAKLTDADLLWTAALRDVNNAETGKAVCFNLLEVNFALGDLDRAGLVLNKLDSYKLSPAEKKSRDVIDKLIADRKFHQQEVKSDN